MGVSFSYCLQQFDISLHFMTFKKLFADLKDFFKNKDLKYGKNFSYHLPNTKWSGGGLTLTLPPPPESVHLPSRLDPPLLNFSRDLLKKKKNLCHLTDFFITSFYILLKMFQYLYRKQGRQFGHRSGADKSQIKIDL